MAVQTITASGAFGATHGAELLTVPAPEVWEIKAIDVLITSGATVGNRQFIIYCADADRTGNAAIAPVPGSMGFGLLTQAATLNRRYVMFPGAPKDAAFDAGIGGSPRFPQAQTPMAAGITLNGISTIAQILAFDTAGIAVALDTFVITVVADILNVPRSYGG